MPAQPDIIVFDPELPNSVRVGRLRAFTNLEGSNGLAHPCSDPAAYDERACASDQLQSRRELIFAPSGSLRQESGATVRQKRLKALHEALPDGKADAVAAHRVPAAVCIRKAA